MNDRTLKLTAAGIAAVTAVAAFCAIFVFVAVMLVANRQSDQPTPDAPLPLLDQVANPSPAPNDQPPAANNQPPTPDPQPPIPDPQSPIPTTHIVQSGENLFRLSIAYGVTVSDIMAANGIVDSRFITAGQALKIPLHLAVAPPAPDKGAASTAAEAAATPEPGSPPTATPLPRIRVNGLALESILVMPDNVRQVARQIYARGQEFGRNPGAYSRLGDSTIENPHFMARFDEGPYVMGDYAYLQETIDHFAGSHGRQGVGVRRGFHSWTVTDPLWADKSLCQPNENSVACEIRIHNPSIMLVRLGSNDAGIPAAFEQNMRQVIDIALESGVLPVIGTKADRFEGSNANNEILRRLANEYQLPLWDFDLVASTIPGRGLDVDGVHLTTFYAHDYTSPTAFQRGHALHNLTALMALDVILREVIRESE